MIIKKFKNILNQAILSKEKEIILNVDDAKLLDDIINNLINNSTINDYDKNIMIDGGGFL